MSLFDPRILARIKSLIPEDLPLYTYLDRYSRPSEPYAVYQTEDLEAPEKLTPVYREFLDGAKRVYDYSLANIRIYDSSFLPYLVQKIPPANQNNKKVLFYGGLSPRREHIINLLRSKDLDITILEQQIFGVDLEVEISKYEYILSTGYYNNIHNDSLRVIPALECGAKILCEKVQESWFNLYLQAFSNRVSFFELT